MPLRSQKLWRGASSPMKSALSPEGLRTTARTSVVSLAVWWLHPTGSRTVAGLLLVFESLVLGSSFAPLDHWPLTFAGSTWTSLSFSQLSLLDPPSFHRTLSWLQSTEHTKSLQVSILASVLYGVGNPHLWPPKLFLSVALKPPISTYTLKVNNYNTRPHISLRFSAELPLSCRIKSSLNL